MDAAQNLHLARPLAVLVLLCACGPALPVRAQSYWPAQAASLATPVDYGSPYVGEGYPAGDNGYQAVHQDDVWTMQLLPEGLIYHSYLASTKDSRFSATFVNEPDWGWLFDGSLGTRVGLFRYGTRDRLHPQGIQFDAEGAAQLRMDTRDQVDVIAVDFRAGAPITFGYGRHRTKFGYYHLSSHVGDEFLLKNPGFPRLNYSRDALLLGHSIYVTDALRVYAETAWSFRLDVAKPWEFQFGVEYAPPCPTDYRGAPFFAANAHLLEEVNFGGGFTVQTGWAWRSEGGQLFRTGFHYYNGESNQFSFFDEHEQQIGFGLWYDN
jgi:hypothetical protein